MRKSFCGRKFLRDFGGAMQANRGGAQFVMQV